MRTISWAFLLILLSATAVRGQAADDPLAPVIESPLTGLEALPAEGHPVRRGAVIGGLVGAGLGLVSSVAICSDDFFDCGAAEVLAVTGIFGGIGAGLGALIGWIAGGEGS